jgi:DNA-binding XRE family transcriptional regulator
MRSSRTTGKPPRAGLAPQEEIAQLRGEVARLRDEVRALRAELAGRAHPASNGLGAEGEAVPSLPDLPAPDEAGYYPAAETLRAILARQIVQRREKVGWTQAELARRAGVRQETVSRLESRKHAPNLRTVDKIDRALKEAGA